MTRPCLYLLALSLLSPTVPVHAQGAAACGEERNRQFDFWIGEWRATENGVPVGTNRVSLRHDGCVIAEEWVGANGLTGSSLSVFDAPSGQWHQTWVDSNGTLLLLSGGMEGDSMILRGHVHGHDGRPDTLHHVSWTALGDGSVQRRQRTRRVIGKPLLQIRLAQHDLGRAAGRAARQQASLGPVGRTRGRRLRRILTDIDQRLRLRRQGPHSQ